MKRILLAFIALFVAFVGLKVNAQETIVNINSNEGSLNSDKDVWTSTSSFAGYDGVESHLTIEDANAWSDYHLAIDDNSFKSTVGAIINLYQETHNLTITAPTDWSIVGYSFNLSTSGVEVSFGSYSNQTSNGQSYSISNLEAKSFNMTVHATGWVRGSATLNNFKIILKKNNYRAPVMSVAQSTDLPTKSSYKKAETAPTEGNPTPFLITSTSNNYALGNTTTTVGLTLINDEYTGEVNINGKPYTFVFESGRKIKCSNGQYLNANVTGRTSRTASLSLANSSSTTWNIEKTDEGGYTVYHTDSYWGTKTNFYLSAPSSAGGQFTLAKNDATKTVQILNGIVKPLEFSIKADYATVYCEDAYLMPEGENGEVLTGYFVKGADEDGEYLTLDEKYHSGEIVPAGTALLIEGPLSTNYKATKYVVKTNGTNADPNAKVYTDADDNQLEGTRVDGVTHSKHEDTHPGNVLYYKLSYGPTGTKYNDVLGFWYGAQDGGAFKPTNSYTAFLAVVKGSVTPAHGFSLPMGDDDTLNSIEIVESVDSAYESDAVYTISGMRVNDSKNLPAGIYIRNGKKFMVR